MIIKLEIIIPNIINRNVTIITPRPLKDSLNILIDSGTKSKIDTDIITPDAKEREPAIILSSFFIFINIKIVPNIVENPAKIVSKKDIPILFI